MAKYKKYGEYGDELLVKQKSSRKKAKEGDVFTIKLITGDYYFGRVISTKALQYLGDAEDGYFYLVYLYNSSSKDKKIIPELKKEELLIPPYFTLSTDWTTGFAETIANIPLDNDDIFHPHYMYCGLRDIYSDGFGNKIDPPAKGCRTPVGDNGFSSLTMLDIDIRKALGIELPEWASI